jgi:hypothetical protein
MLAAKFPTKFVRMLVRGFYIFLIHNERCSLLLKQLSYKIKKLDAIVQNRVMTLSMVKIITNQL